MAIAWRSALARTASAVLFLLPVAGPAAAQEYLCGGAVLKGHEFGYTASTYTVFWRCEAYYGKNHEIQEVTFHGRWDRVAKVATEDVHDRFSYYYDGALKNDLVYPKKVTASCPDDPWLYDVGCSGHQVDPLNPVLAGVPTHPSLPKGAHLLRTSGHSGALRVLYEERLGAPKIVTPAEGATFPYPGNVDVRVEHNPKFGLDFFVGWRPDAQHAMTQVTNSVIFGKATANGVTTGKLNLIKPGQWTIRARLNTDVKAWWSAPHFFKAQEGGVGQIVLPGALKLKPGLAHLDALLPPPAPVTILRPKPDEEFAGAVKVRIQLPAQPATTKVRLKFLKKQGGDWVEKAVLPGYDAAALPGGIEIPAAKFGAGAWRVKAAMDLANAPWAGPVKFTVP